MGLISKEVEINICGGNYKHYEELGYHIPRSKNKWGRMGILQGTKIIVKVEDLQKIVVLWSNVLVMDVGVY